MKILHLIYTNGVAGAEKYLIHLLPLLPAEGYQCHLIIICAPGFQNNFDKYLVQLKEAGVPVVLKIAARKDFISAASQINKFLKANKISVLHSHLLNSDLLAVLTKIFFYRSLTIISTKHGYNEQVLKKLNYTFDAEHIKQNVKKDLHYRATQFVMRFIDHNYAVSEAFAKLYINMGFTTQQMPYIHHGITIAPPEQNNRFRLAKKQLITVGRLEEIKGLEYLLRAMVSVIKEYPEVKLLLLGEGILKKDLQRLARELHVDDNIEFLGFISKPYSYIEASDVSVQPSLMESFGLVYIEAFALGTPLVAFETESGKEIIDHNENGLLAQLKNADDLADKILFMLQNSLEAKKMAAKAYEKYLRRFTTETMISNTAAFYNRILR